MNIFTKICQSYDIGLLKTNPKQILSGLVNQVWEIETSLGKYIVKIINTNSIRARSEQEYRATESLAAYLKDQAIPTVVALKTNNSRILPMDNNQLVIVYPWVAGQQVCGHLGPMPPLYAQEAGDILGRIHHLQLKEFDYNFSYSYVIDQTQWELYFRVGQRTAWYDVLKPNFSKLLEYNQRYLLANQNLQQHQIYSHGDYFPHNLLWDNKNGCLIDWELAGLVNPEMELILALILFSGLATENSYSEASLKAFYQGYNKHQIKFVGQVEDAFWGAIGKAWLNWLAYNMQQSIAKEVIATYQSLIAILNKKELLFKAVLDQNRELHI